MIRHICLAAALMALIMINPLAAAQQTNLIPRDLLFGQKDKSVVRISPDGNRVAYKQLFPDPGLYLTDSRDASNPQRINIDGEILDWDWSQLNTLIAVIKKDFNPVLAEINPATGATRQFTLPEFTQAHVSFTSPRHPAMAAVSVNSTDSLLSGIYIVYLSDMKSERVAPDVGFSQFYFDQDLGIRAGIMPNDKGASTLMAKNPNGDWVTVEDYDYNDGRFSGSLEGVVSITADGTKLYYVDNVGSDKACLKSYNLVTGEKQKIYEDPNADLLWMGAVVNPASGEPQAVASIFGTVRRYFADKSVEMDFDKLKKRFNDGAGFAGQSSDGSTWLLRDLYGGPIVYYAYDRKSGALHRLFSDMASLDNYKFARRSAFIVKASDGLDLPCTLYLPDGSDNNNDNLPDTPLPTLLYVHGGPWVGFWLNNWFINRNLQLLANRGYAVILCEFRSSVGFGKKFIDAGNKQWGGKMHQDLLDIAKAAVDKNIAIRNKLGIWGWSYGGYATNMALARSPETFACGISMYGVADLDNICRLPNFDDSLWRQRVGDVHTEEGARMLKEHSPINYVTSIIKPLLITHGEKDQVVPKNQSDMLAEAMMKNGKKAIYFYYPDEPHDFRKAESWQSFWAVAEQFLHTYLGGQFEPKGSDLKASAFVIVQGGEFIEELM